MPRPLTDDEQAKVHANMGLVHEFCRKYRSDPRHEDLVSAGYIGLCRAVQKFNPSIAQLSTYAWKCISQEVRAEKCRMAMIRLSHKHYERGAETRFLPATSQAAQRAMKAHKIDFRDVEAVTVLAIDQGDQYRDYTELRQEVDKLNPRDQFIITEMVVQGRTQKSVGEDLGITKERARQLKARALGTLRRRLDKLEKSGSL